MMLYCITMTASKFLLPILLLLPSLCIGAQTVVRPARTVATSQTQLAEDELTGHLSAAETYQLSGNLEQARVENRHIVRIALMRLGTIAVREGELNRAVQLLTDSLTAGDDAEARTNLAIAYMRLSEIDKAIAQAQAATTLDSKNARAYYLSGKLLYTKGDYKAALPALERVIVLKPDFDAAYMLGMTYLQLKQIERAKLLFEEMQAVLKNKATLHALFGRAYDETGFHREAERELKQALAIEPKMLGVNFYLGYVTLQNGGSERLPEAAQAFEAELQLNPNDAFATFLRGVVASAENEHPKAVRYLQAALRLNPELGEAYLFLGQSQVELGDNDAAEKNLRRAIELTSDVSRNSYQIRRAHFLLGRLLIKTGRKIEGEKELAAAKEIQGQLLESTRQDIKSMLGQIVGSAKDAFVSGDVSPASNRTKGEKTSNELNADDKLAVAASTLTPHEAAKYRNIKSQLSELLAQANHNLGVIAAQQNLLAESIERFATAAEWKPDFPGLDRNWGIIGFRAGQYEKAIAPLSRHVKAHAEDALARRMLGVSFYLTKNFQQAVETLKPIEATLINDAELAYFYGVALVQLDKQPMAATLFARLAKQYPTSAEPRFYAAQGFMITGDYEQALKEFRAVAELDAKRIGVHYNAGQSLIRLNRAEEAEREFRQELLLNPTDEVAKYHLAYVLIERKQRTDEALSLLREVVAARPDYADALYQLGKILIEQNVISEAIEHLENAARIEPNKDYIHYQLNIAYRRVGRTADADRELKLYRELKASNRSRELDGTGAKQNVP